MISTPPHCRTNACVDIIVPGVKLLHALGIAPGPASDLSTLNSFGDLQSVFHHFLGKGAAAERYFVNQTVFQSIVDAALKLENAEVSDEVSL